MKKNWKTTLVFGLASVCQIAAQMYPEHSGILNPLTALFTALGGAAAADAVNVKG